LKSRQLTTDLVSMLLKTLFIFVTLLLRQNKLDRFKQNLKNGEKEHMPLQRVGMVRSVGYNVTIKRLGLKCSHGTNTLAYLGAGSMLGHK
jgi:hypothetical protein